MTKFKDNFRIESARLNGWDYSKPWYYYVTVNTKNHEEYFGQIRKGEVKLNSLGKIIEEELLRTNSVRSNVEIDTYVIMPNHIHAIIIINERKDDPSDRLPGNNEETKTMQRIVSTTLKTMSLGSIIGQFTSICTKRIKNAGMNNFVWQSRYYDRITRNEKELLKIGNYIKMNPLRWDLEKEYLENIFDV